MSVTKQAVSMEGIRARYEELMERHRANNQEKRRITDDLKELRKICPHPDRETKEVYQESWYHCPDCELDFKERCTGIDKPSGESIFEIIPYNSI